MNVPHTVKDNIVSLSKKDFDAMLEHMEELEDIVAFDRAVAADEEGFPAELAERIITGESPVRVFREYRNLTQDELAAQCGIKKAMVSKIEGGSKAGSIETIQSIARALNVDVDDLI